MTAIQMTAIPTVSVIGRVTALRAVILNDFRMHALDAVLNRRNSDCSMV